jgi:tetratricopeptide (TPR) repeat protein
MADDADEKGKLSQLFSDIERNPDDVRAINARGLWYLRNEEYQLAVKDFDAALRCDSQNVTSHTNRGIGLYRLQKYEEAVQALSSSLEIEPSLPLAWYYRGLALKELGQKTEARNDIVKSAELYGKQNKHFERQRSLNALTGLMPPGFGGMPHA